MVTTVSTFDVNAAESENKKVDGSFLTMKEKVSNTYTLGLKRGQVKLVPHQTDWHKDAACVIKTLKEILGKCPFLSIDGG